MYTLMFQRDQVYLVRTDLLSFEDLKEKLGLEVGVSRWFTIDQTKVSKLEEAEVNIEDSFSEENLVQQIEDFLNNEGKES